MRLTGASMEVRFRDTLLGTMPLTLDAIHALYDSLDPRLLLQGLDLAMTPKALRTPLGFEALMQVAMINVVHCVFPRFNLTTPLRMHMQLQSMDAEINNIRNTALVNQTNHVHVLSGALKGLPMVVALPGPSLDLDFLREKRSSFILLAAGRAAGKLLEAGIDPDLVYMQDVNAKAWDLSFAALSDRRSKAVLVANPLGKLHAHARIFSRVFKAWNLYSFETDAFPKLEEIAPSSVSGAYSLARLLGCDPVVFMGNDCGANTKPRSHLPAPQDQCSIPFRDLDRELLFEPTDRMYGLYLRFADEFSVTTQTDYAAGAQWLKMRARRDAAQSGVRFYDNSTTRLCRFLSPIQDASALGPVGTHKLPRLPAYRTSFDPMPLLRQKAKAYALIAKLLSRGEMPASALRRPYSCILQGTDMAFHDRLEPTPEDMAHIRANLDTVQGHLDAAMAAQQPPPAADR